MVGCRKVPPCVASKAKTSKKVRSSMRAISSHVAVLRLVSIVMLLAFAVVAVAADAPANVAGNWSVDVSDGSRKTTQTITLKQDGGTITGTFKGPRQSGMIDGT